MSTPDDSATPEHQQPSPADESEASASQIRPVLSSEAEKINEADASTTTNEAGQTVTVLPQVASPARPITATPPVPPSDDDDFIPRGKTTQTLVGGGKKGGRPH